MLVKYTKWLVFCAGILFVTASIAVVSSVQVSAHCKVQITCKDKTVLKCEGTDCSSNGTCVECSSPGMPSPVISCCSGSGGQY